MIDDPNLDRMPGWRRAFLSFRDAGYKPGDVITVEWLQDELGVEIPAFGTADDFKRAQLKWLHEFDKLHDRIRNELMLFLRREEDAYVVLTASEQLAHAQAEGRRRLRSAMRWQADVLLTTNVDSLSDAERSQHADAMARMARLRSMTRLRLTDKMETGDK